MGSLVALVVLAQTCSSECLTSTECTLAICNADSCQLIPGPECAPCTNGSCVDGGCVQPKPEMCAVPLGVCYGGEEVPCYNNECQTFAGCSGAGSTGSCTYTNIADCVGCAGGLCIAGGCVDAGSAPQCQGGGNLDAGTDGGLRDGGQLGGSDGGPGTAAAFNPFSCACGNGVGLVVSGLALVLATRGRPPPRARSQSPLSK